MRESFHCDACGQDCAIVRRGAGLGFEYDSELCHVRGAPQGGGKQTELIAFALENPKAKTCAYWQRVAQGCMDITAKQ
jgi:hypothetical protein